jgi:hypothetical protein
MNEKKTLRSKVAQAVKRLSIFGKVEEVAERRRHSFHGDAVHGRERAEAIRAQLQDKHLLVGEREDLEQELLLVVHAVERRMKKLNFWRKRYAWAHARHNHWGLVLKHRRDRLRRWIAQHQTFQPYMANGKPFGLLTPEAKHAIYLDFRDGNFVTSTYEGFPGDGVHATSSYHYIQNQPDGKARCWDAGAGTLGPMEKAQAREARRCPAFLTEMFGPINGDAFKNGVRFTLTEGSELETMHDNHKHTCIRDGAPTK